MEEEAVVLVLFLLSCSPGISHGVSLVFAGQALHCLNLGYVTAENKLLHASVVCQDGCFRIFLYPFTQSPDEGNLVIVV